MRGESPCEGSRRAGSVTLSCSRRDPGDPMTNSKDELNSSTIVGSRVVGRTRRDGPAYRELEAGARSADQDVRQRKVSQLVEITPVSTVTPARSRSARSRSLNIITRRRIDGI